jgi:murein endopeptidase
VRRLLFLIGLCAASVSASAVARAPMPGAPCPPIVDPTRLPLAGRGWRIPERWAERGIHWGSRDLVGLIRRAAARFARLAPGATIGVADLSPRGGGPSPWHRTHQHGLDVDLLLFMRDAQGRPAEIRAMVACDCAGKGAAMDSGGNAVPPLTFDVARTWALVRALVEDRGTTIEDILISNCLRRQLLAHARAVRAPRAVLDRAAELLRQPRLSPHNDHMHIAIAAPERCAATGFAKGPSARSPVPSKAAAPASAPAAPIGSEAPPARVGGAAPAARVGGAAPSTRGGGAAPAARVGGAAPARGSAAAPPAGRPPSGKAAAASQPASAPARPAGT